MNNIGLEKFKIINIQTKSENLDRNDKEFSDCNFCNRKEYSIGVFDICNHYCCTECIDSLYDMEKTEEKKEELFLCPICRKSVKEIDYR
jgi:hypothetical protein